MALPTGGADVGIRGASQLTTGGALPACLEWLFKAGQEGMWDFMSLALSSDFLQHNLAIHLSHYEIQAAQHGNHYVVDIEATAT